MVKRGRITGKKAYRILSNQMRNKESSMRSSEENNLVLGDSWLFCQDREDGVLKFEIFISYNILAQHSSDNCAPPKSP